MTAAATKGTVLLRPLAFIWNGAKSVLRDRRCLIGLAALLGVWTLAFVRLFDDPTPRIPVLINWTASLPYHVAWLERDPVGLKRGDFILYSFDGLAARDYPGLKRQPFFKLIAGVPGDAIRVDGRNVFVNEAFVGFAKLRTMDGRALHPVSPAAVPGGHFYARGTGVDSLDSRYAEGGFVAVGSIIGRVHPWF